MENKEKINNEDIAVIYARYSSDNQREESIEAQVRACETYAKEHGLIVVKHYIDRAKTATNDKRSGFTSLINDSNYKTFSKVILHKLDRFSRDRYLSAISKHKLRKNGVTILSVLENLDDSPESGMLETVIEGMAEYYSKNLAREVRKGAKETALQAKHNGGVPPIGYDVHPETRKYVINETEAITVKFIFDLYNNGNGYDNILTALNERGYRTKLGNAFGKNSLHDLISNEKYTGTFLYNKSSAKTFCGSRNTHSSKNNDEIIRIEGGMPAIISKEDFAKAKERMADNKRRAGAYHSKENYALRKKIYCGECGYAMIGNMRYGGRNKTKYVSYRCGNRDQYKQCDNKEIRREYIEHYVLDQLETLIFNNKAIPILVKRLNEFRLTRVSEKSIEIIAIKNKMQELSDKISNILEAIMSGQNHKLVNERLQVLEEEKEKLELKLVELENEECKDNITEDTLKTMIPLFKEYVSTNNSFEVEKFLDSYVDKVLIFHDRVEVAFKIDDIAEGFSIESEEKIKKLHKMYKNVV